ncbi:hypothetical protein NIES4071_38310 [Calothrix sp. NIES-4071]|nr:hypothetical protein NIES4071_38310 [Calothrix sp. NIES-4071]BAZ58148.1 hypothetical protein NIES4105_38240 [Calothrix sp. NIES-4105]
MPFAFEIISTREVHRDFGEDSYRHWTLLIGVLRSGVIKLRDHICLPSQTEQNLVATIIGFEPDVHDAEEGEKRLMIPSRAFSQNIPDFMRRRGKLWLKQSSKKQVRASEVKQPFMLVTWEPAYNATDISLGGVATECSNSYYENHILEILQQTPETILHCRDCATHLSNIPAAMPTLKELFMHPNREIVSRAVNIYNYLHWQQSKGGLT